MDAVQSSWLVDMPVRTLLLDVEVVVRQLWLDVDMMATAMSSDVRVLNGLNLC
jgi:hypothetical protein